MTWLKIERIGCLGLAALLLLAPSVGIAEDEDGFEGSVELLWRNVSQDGSSEKYDEDFDGLDSGARLASLSAHWFNLDSGVLDYARLDVTGLGGEPHESNAFRLGRKDSYELSFRNTKQDYLYNLFELVPGEDGAAWNSQRRNTDLDLTVHASETTRLFFEFHNGKRDGTSLFMKDIQRDVFRLETPLDQEMKRYTVGATFEVGVVDILLRQSLRRYDNNFNNLTEGDLGLDTGNAARLDHYDWRQQDNVSTDFTTLRLHAAPHDRVDLTVSLLGTLIGEEELDSRVSVEQLGNDFNGAEFGGECAATGAPCSTDASCDAVTPGDVCEPLTGTSRATLDGDTILAEVDLSVLLVSPLELHLQYRSLDRELSGRLDRDLDGDGVEEDEDGDGTPGSDTTLDYDLDTISAILEYRPVRQVSLRGGYRLINRELSRNGFGGLRDVDFQSDDDETLLFGLMLRPVKWFKLNADYEDGDIEQPFNAVAPQESEHTRVRAVFTPQDDMRIDLGYLDFDYKNTAPDIRAPGERWNGSSEGTTWSAAFWHKANEWIDYYLRYADQEVESDVRIEFDSAVFGGVDTGNSIFDNDNTQFLGQLNFRWGSAWKGHFRYWMTESDGDNRILNDAPMGFTNNEVIDQEYEDFELGLTYGFDSGMYVGASFRDFDYDDRNDLIDYDGQIFSIRAGLTF